MCIRDRYLHDIDWTNSIPFTLLLLSYISITYFHSIPLHVQKKTKETKTIKEKLIALASNNSGTIRISSCLLREIQNEPSCY